MDKEDRLRQLLIEAVRSSTGNLKRLSGEIEKKSESLIESLQYDEKNGVLLGDSELRKEIDKLAGVLEVRNAALRLALLSLHMAEEMVAAGKRNHTNN